MDIIPPSFPCKALFSCVCNPSLPPSSSPLAQLLMRGEAIRKSKKKRIIDFAPRIFSQAPPSSLSIFFRWLRVFYELSSPALSCFTVFLTCVYGFEKKSSRRTGTPKLSLFCLCRTWKSFFTETKNRTPNKRLTERTATPDVRICLLSLYLSLCVCVCVSKTPFHATRGKGKERKVQSISNNKRGGKKMSLSQFSSLSWPCPVVFSLLPLL